MISIEVNAERIEVSGHASYAPAGYDIVCEAVTCLCQTLVASINDLCGEPPAYTMNKGYFEIERPLSGRAHVLTEAFLIGCRLLAAEYSRYICLSEH